MCRPVVAGKKAAKATVANSIIPSHTVRQAPRGGSRLPSPHWEVVLQIKGQGFRGPSTPVYSFCPAKLLPITDEEHATGGRNAPYCC